MLYKDYIEITCLKGANVSILLKRTCCLTLASGLEKKQRTLPQTDSFTDIRLSLASGLASYVSGHDASYHKINCRL